MNIVAGKVEETNDIGHDKVNSAPISSRCHTKSIHTYSIHTYSHAIIFWQWIILQ